MSQESPSHPGLTSDRRGLVKEGFKRNNRVSGQMGLISGVGERERERARGVGRLVVSDPEQ